MPNVRKCFWCFSVEVEEPLSGDWVCLNDKCSGGLKPTSVVVRLLAVPRNAVRAGKAFWRYLCGRLFSRRVKSAHSPTPWTPEVPMAALYRVCVAPVGQQAWFLPFNYDYAIGWAVAQRWSEIEGCDVYLYRGSYMVQGFVAGTSLSLIAGVGYDV